MQRYTTLIAAALVLTGTAGTAGQQQQVSQEPDIAARVQQVRNGTVRLTFAARPGVCGDGESFISSGRRDDDNRSIFRQSRRGLSMSTGASDFDGERCEEGPLRVALAVRNGEVTEVDSYVGKRWAAEEQALTVSARSAVAYLLQIAEHGSESAGRHIMVPVVLADSVEPWPDLLRIARNERSPLQTRKSAIFWLGQAAGDKATAGLKDLLSADDREVKKSAVFALSQIKSEQSVDALIDIVKNSRDKEVRKSALFWLSQSDDFRVLALYEDILLKN